MNERPTQEQLMEIVEPLQNGALNDALDKARRLDVLFPDFPITQNLKGIILKEMGRYEDALVPLQAATTQRPDYVEAHNNLGIVLDKLGHHKDAARHYMSAIDQKPDYAEALNNLGCLMKNMDRFEEALTLLNKAISLIPDYVDALGNKGQVLMHLGNTEAAIPVLEQAINLNPHFFRMHRNLSECKTYAPGDPHVAQMEALLAQGAASGTDGQALQFALGKAYDDMGKYDQAFAQFSAANKALDAASPYNYASDQHLFHQLKTNFTGTLPVVSEPAGAHQPVFIVGMPRSGTSLTEQILASHSRVYGAGELELMHTVLRDTKTLRQPLSENLLRNIRTGYLGGLTDLEAKSPVITDKMPINFQWIGFILQSMPEAKIIHCSRDAMAVCWSIYRRGFVSPGNGYRYSLANIAKFYHLYQDLMAFWHQRYPGRILDMDYEIITQNQMRETQRLLDFVGLDWEDNCMNFHMTMRAVQTASSNQVRRKMYQGSSDVWRNYEAHLNPLLSALGVSGEKQA
ncbi:MAG: sulfotransferase [Litoreibacter sp.]|uniref:tetratricopeptide repeat-containing sulfotransferase family protein n=1 Tax=Litoreibacter sp. TaxID=1969459 RepID=UPI003297AE40